MGQRLNFEILSNGELIANCYYHWGDTVEVALELLDKGVNKFKEIKRKRKKPNKYQIAYDILKATGAELQNEEEIKLAKTLNIKLPKNVKPVGRNKGLIDFSERGMKGTRFEEEGRVSIDIETNEIVFNPFWYMTKEEYKEDRKVYSWHRPKFEYMPLLDFKIVYLTFEEYKENKKIILKHLEKKEIDLKINENEVIFFP